MKRLIMTLAILFILLSGGFMFLLAAAGPDNASQDVVTIELPDTFEK